MAAISDDGSKAMERSLDGGRGDGGAFAFSVSVSEGARCESEAFRTQYDIAGTVERIKAGNYVRVALQFPDGLLSDAPAVAAAICAEDPVLFGPDGDTSVFVLGDTSYGACCVDEVTAAHMCADLIVHYGHACLSRTSTKPAYYVFGRRTLDAGKLAASLDAAVDAQAGSDPRHLLLVVSHVSYYYASDQVKRAVRSTRPLARFSHVEGCFFEPHASRRKASDSTTCIAGQTLSIDGVDNADSVTVLYIGSDESQRSQIALRFSQHAVYYFDGEACLRETLNTNRILSRRFLMVSKLKDAAIVGFLVGTMGVEGYNDILEHLETIAASSGVATYTFLMGKINAAKLANFPEIDAFVMIACPEHTLVNSRDFYKPVATPMEFEVAMGKQEWNVSYSTHFDELRSNVAETDSNEGNNTDVDDDAPHFSLATGGLVHKRSAAKRQEDEDGDGDARDSSSNALVDVSKKPSQIALRYSSAAGDLLAGRTFRGLDPKIGESDVHAATMGHVGRAAGYTKLADALDKLSTADSREDHV